MVLRTTRITVETESLMVVRRAKAVVAWCPDCHAEVDVITLSQDSFSEANYRGPGAAVARYRQASPLAVRRGSSPDLREIAVAMLHIRRKFDVFVLPLPVRSIT